MPKKMEVTVFEFGELEARVQNSVIEMYRTQMMNLDKWDEDVLREYEHVLSVLGFSRIHISYTLRFSQGDGASFTALWCKSKCKDSHNPHSIPEFHRPLYESWFYKLMNVNVDDHDSDEVIERITNAYSHSRTVTCSNRQLLEVSREIMAEIYQSLESLYTDITSDESVRECILSDEQLFFFASGKVFNNGE